MSTKTGAAKVPVALPKSNDSAASAPTASASLIGQDSALYDAIGGRVRVTTSANTTLEGTIYTADPLTSLLILETSSNSTTISPRTLAAPAGSYRIIPISQISSFTILSPGPGNTTSTESSQPSPHIDTAAASQRLATAVASAQAALSRQGPRGTSRSDQALFDALARKYSTRWEGNNMVISDSFIIEKPYSSATTGMYAASQQANGGSGSDFKGDLTRFRKVVDLELNKAQLRVGQQGLEGRIPGPTAEGERKGG